MDLAGLLCHRSEIRSYSFLRKTETVWVCINSRDPNNLNIREPMPIKAANHWIALAVMFYLVGLDRRIPLEERS